MRGSSRRLVPWGEPLKEASRAATLGATYSPTLAVRESLRTSDGHQFWGGFGPAGFPCSTYFRRVTESSTPAWDRITRLVDRNKRPHLLASALEDDTLPWDEYLPAVVDAWTMAESPESHYGAEFWVWHFREAGYFHDGADHQSPAAPMTLYRGCSLGRERRMSWTDDLDTARWFAARVGDSGLHGRVIQAKVQPWRVLAYIHEEGRGESEWVIDSRSIRYKVYEESGAFASFEEMTQRPL